MDFRTRLALALGQMQMALIEAQMQNEDLTAQLAAQPQEAKAAEDQTKEEPDGV